MLNIFTRCGQVLKGDSSDEEAVEPNRGLNSLFAGGDSAKETKAVFEDKIANSGKNKKKEKLTAGAFLLAPRALDTAKLQKSKQIKKGAGAHTITKEMVQAKLKNRRLAIP